MLLYEHVFTPPVTALDFNIICTVVSVTARMSSRTTSFANFLMLVHEPLAPNRPFLIRAELCAVVVFHRSHKIIINQTKLSNPLQIFLMCFCSKSSSCSDFLSDIGSPAFCLLIQDIINPHFLQGNVSNAHKEVMPIPCPHFKITIVKRSR